MISRRQWISTVGGGLGLAAAASAHAEAPANIDFRYSPFDYQTAFCVPDDPHKSLVRQDGALLYGYAPGHNLRYFSTIVRFSLQGMEPDRIVRQELESPQAPIVHTLIERPSADLLLTTFATNRAGEGRVDNVLVEVRPRSARTRHVVPLAIIETRAQLAESRRGKPGLHRQTERRAAVFGRSACPSGRRWPQLGRRAAR